MTFTPQVNQEIVLMEQKLFKISLLITNDGGTYTAQCLQFDIAAQGATISEAKERFARTFITHIAVNLEKGQVPLEGVPQAPIECWNLWNSAQPLQGTLPMHLATPTWMISVIVEELRVL